MKKNLMAALLISGLALVLAWHTTAFAQDKEKTIIGEGQCAKCVLKEAQDCQIVITVGEGDAKLTYYLVNNEVTKEFGDQLCKKSHQVTATGTVKARDGRIEMNPSKIELVKELVKDLE